MTSQAKTARKKRDFLKENALKRLFGIKKRVIYARVCDIICLWLAAAAKRPRLKGDFGGIL
jgi:hypothetical protein